MIRFTSSHRDAGVVPRVGLARLSLPSPVAGRFPERAWSPLMTDRSERRRRERRNGRQLPGDFADGGALQAARAACAAPQPSRQPLKGYGNNMNFI